MKTVNPSPPTNPGTCTRNQISYQSVYQYQSFDKIVAAHAYGRPGVRIGG